jgi:uncharacterized protein (DUF362 family)
MNFSYVIVRKGQDGYALTRDVLSALGIDRSEIGDTRIFIKPNAGRLVGPRTGINTNPETVAAVIDHFIELGFTNIVIAESPILGVKALESLEKCGITEVARARNIPLIDLDAEPPVTVEIPDGRVIQKLRVCKEVLENNYIISVPVIKTHMHTQVSLGLKNMKGCLYGREKVLLHQLPPSDAAIPPSKPLDMAIADMARILIPDLTVIDGTIAQEGLGPSAGFPKETGIVLASRNCLACDTVAVELMGFDPAKVHHLRETILQKKENDSRYDFEKNQITVDPPSYRDWTTQFMPPPDKVSLEYANVAVEDRDSCSACLSTVLMFLKRYYTDFADYLSAEKPLRIAIGKAIGPQNETTLLIGNCTVKQKGRGIFIQGCPPVASQIASEIEKLYPEMKDNDGSNKR